MKYSITVLASALFFLVAIPVTAQIRIETNLPRMLPLNQPTGFDVYLKGDHDSELRIYEIRAPRGLRLSAGEKELQHASFKDGAVTVTLTSHEGAATHLELTIEAVTEGDYTVSQKVQYKDAARGEEIFSPFDIKAGGTSAEFSAFGLTTLHPQSAVAKGKDPKVVYYTDPEEMKLHLMQLYNDSKEIYLLGEAERKKASEKLEDATVVLRQSEHITEEKLQERIALLAVAEQTTATRELDLADKIIQISASLESDASGFRSFRNIHNTPNTGFKKTGIENGQLRLAGESLLVDGSSGTVYRVQLGAFKKRRPSENTYLSFGSVDIIRENGYYKVLLGSFSSKEEAAETSGQISRKGQPAFVAKYVNGRREL